MLILCNANTRTCGTAGVALERIFMAGLETASPTDRHPRCTAARTANHKQTSSLAQIHGRWAWRGAAIGKVRDPGTIRVPGHSSGSTS